MRQNLRSPAANMQRELLAIKRLVGQARPTSSLGGAAVKRPMQKLCIIMPRVAYTVVVLSVILSATHISLLAEN